MEKKIWREKKLLACVCLSLIIGPVEDIQHITGALISEMSFYVAVSLFTAIWARDWLGLMAICHANDGVPNRFGMNAPPETSEQEGSERSVGN